MSNQERAWVEDVWCKLENKMAWVHEKSRDKIPYLTVNGVHDDRSATDRVWSEGDGLAWWTNGFWGGLMWLMYHETNDRRYAEIAAISEQKMDACFDSFYGLHHDVGFMWRPTAAADYDLTGNPVSLKRALHAANLLAGRFNPAGNYIRAWNSTPGGEGDNSGWAIIDCMMNLSLLYWATEQTGDPRFRHIAMRHADTAMNAFVRQDGSVRHIVVFDPESGRYLHSLGGQGYAHGSSWTRGQGWGVYGFMISYHHTGEERYLRTAERIADSIIPHIPDSGIIPVDFRQPAEPAWEDSCGACVIAGGLLELAKAERIPARKRALYLEKALLILRAIDEKRADWSEGCDSIVLNCSGAYHDKHHHFTMVYADYYFAEAIAKLRGSRLWMW
ncbi:MAG: glycoside hydrolase family 88 protein [Aristaeellaceae bacterium]